jgi:hypothetical protein
MKRLFVLLALGPVMALSVAAGAASEGRVVCGPAMAKTLKKTERLRVFRRGGRAFVCSRYSSRVWELEQRPDADDCRYSSQGCRARLHLRVAGRWVVQTYQHFGGGQGDIGWVTLRAAGARRGAFLSATYQPFYAVALDRYGAIAWVQNHDADPYSLVLRKGGGCDSTDLDVGNGIDPRSVRIVDGDVHWTHDGQPKTAPACPIDSH